MNEKILFVDDDELILASYERSLRRQFSLETALGPQQALDKVTAEGPYAVIVSDMRMPGMDGLELLRRTHGISPDSVGLILTGNADLRTAIHAVNEGHIFRFLEKPCPNDVLAKVLITALAQHQLACAEKELLEKTLHGSIKVLTDVLGLVNPEAFSTASRIALYARHISAKLDLKDQWRFEMAAMLSQLGSVVLPTETLEAVRLGNKLSKDQEARFAGHPAVARDLLRRIPRLESVAEMVGRQSEHLRVQLKGPISLRDDETVGAQILKVCIQFERLIRAGDAQAMAIARLRSRQDEYALEVVIALSSLETEAPACEPHIVSVEKLTCQMVLDEDLRTKDGMLLVAKGIQVTETLMIRINNFYQRGSVPGSIRVLTPVLPP